MKGPAALLVTLVLLLCSAPAAPGQTAGWAARRAAAVEYVLHRAGVASFAVIDERGRLRGYRPGRIAPSASLLKPMLLVAYLNKPVVRTRALTASERGLLGPMIRRSDNDAAGVILDRVGAGRLYALARRARMGHFRLRSPWGLSEVTAAGQARFFQRIDLYVPARHRVYARRLLAGIVPAQRWGIPPVKPPGWRLFFKGGWGSGTGRVTHQSALLKQGTRRLSLSVLTEWNPNHTYGTRTIRGIAQRLLHSPLPSP